jgi:hypothetical protein
MVGNTFNPTAFGASGYEELNDLISEIESISTSNGCDLTVDVELNGPSKIVLTCDEYEIEILLGVDGDGR